LLWRVLSPSFAYAAVAAAWAVQIGHGSSTLRKLGLSDAWLGLAWLAGPIAGVLVAGPIGSLSDTCTSRFGRRRPFLLGGSVGAVISLLFFSNAENIANAVGKPVRESRLALWIAIGAFWALDATLSVMQGPARTLLGDVLEPQMQASGNSFFAAAYFVGKIIGYAAGGFRWRVEVTYGIAAAFVLVLTSVTLLTSRESVLERDRENETDAEEGGQKALGSPMMRKWWNLYFVKLPQPVTRVCIVQVFTYFAWMIVIVYGADWVGKDVMLGSADAAPGTDGRNLFERGVQQANHGFLLMAVVAIVLSFGIPPAMRVVGTKLVWSFALCVFGGALLASPAVHGRAGVLGLFGALSVPLAATFSIPWAVVQLALDEAGMAAERGAMLSTFNLSQSLPGIAAALVGGLVVRAAKGDLVAVIQLAGASALAAASAVWTTVLPAELS
jgi:solute carrier family 45, member 1/2/4